MASDAARSDELARLLARVALHDRAAFEQVYRRTCEHLLGVAYGILNRRDRAEDTLQEAFINVWRGAARFDPALGGPMTWLINVVRNKAIDKLRSGRSERENTVEIDDDTMQLPADAATQPQALLDDSLVRAHIAGCMGDLAAAQRQAIALAYYRGMVHTEIAASLGAPLGTVKAWVRRGTDKLRGCLQAAGVSAA